MLLLWYINATERPSPSLIGQGRAAPRSFKMSKTIYCLSVCLSVCLYK